MDVLLIPLILYAISLLFLGIRLKTGEKRYFLLAVLPILFASGYVSITESFSVLWIFFWAITFSFIGDLLMAQIIQLTQHRTVDGVMAFGIAHLIYIYGFYELNVGNFDNLDWWLILIGVLLAITLFYYLGYNEKFHIAVLVSNFIYSAIITTLFIFVLVFIMSPQLTAITVISALVGVILFMVSDGVLAYNEFQQKIPNAKNIIAVTYVLAQILLQITPILTI